jgi:uncharacterized protein
MISNRETDRMPMMISYLRRRLEPRQIATTTVEAVSEPIRLKGNLRRGNQTGAWVRLITTAAVLAIWHTGTHAAPLPEGAVFDPEDYRATARRIMPLAQRGDPHAQALLGFMYQYGRGIPQSYNLAVRWYIQAAEGGDANGQYLLGLMYDKGLGVGQDIVLAYKWLDLAAANAPRRTREPFTRLRDAVATKMTRTQIDMAQQLAVEFVPR